MKTKGWAALCLMLLLVIVGSQFFKAPSYMKWVTEGFFSNTLAKKDDAFNHVLSKDKSQNLPLKVSKEKKLNSKIIILTRITRDKLSL